jgi:hypothetical protein
MMAGDRVGVMAMGRIVQSRPGRACLRSVGPRTRGDVVTEEKIRFTSSILPKWARRTKSLDALLPFSTCVGCPPATSRRCSPPATPGTSPGLAFT